MKIEMVITASWKNRTLTLRKDSELVTVRIDWTQNPPLIRASVRLTNPRLPTARPLAEFQASIHDHQPIRYRLVVQRVSVDGIGPESEPIPPELVPQDPPAPDGLDRARRALELPAFE